MMGVAARFDALSRENSGVRHRMNESARFKTVGQGSRENGSPVSAIYPRVGERSSKQQRWKVISL